MELLYRDEFGVHGRAVRGFRALIDSIRAFLRRALSSVTKVLVRPRRLTLEHAFWVVIVALLVLFVIVLIAGETGVGRGGR